MVGWPDLSDYRLLSTNYLHWTANKRKETSLTIASPRLSTQPRLFSLYGMSVNDVLSPFFFIEHKHRSGQSSDGDENIDERKVFPHVLKVVASNDLVHAVSYISIPLNTKNPLQLIDLTATDKV